LPSLPALILQPDTTSSRHQSSGFFCHSTNPPTSPPPPPLPPFFPPRCPLPVPPPPPPPPPSPSLLLSSAAVIRTLPIAYMLVTLFSAHSPPDAAMYCCTMYFADDDSWRSARARAQMDKSADQHAVKNDQ
jgi:hypothetical protein